MFILICFLSILLIPSIANAWGPLTHVYLAHQVLDIGAAIAPAGIYSLLRRFKNDFLYGNLSADIILGRKFQVFEKNSHSWDVAWRLLEVANTDRQKSFAYGYLTHLSADTVIHNLNGARLPFRHSILEVKSESIIQRKYSKILKSLDRAMQKRNDNFLEEMLESVFFSFKTNKRIFKGLLLLSSLHNYSPVFSFIHKRLPYEPLADIYHFHQESLNRMFELFRNGKSSEVMREHPLGNYKNGRQRSKIYS